MFTFSVRTPAQRDIPKRASLGRMVSQSTALLMTCIGLLILILALLILFHENANATKGYSLRRLESDRSILLLQQEVLNMQIAEAQALAHLQQDAQIQKMIPTNNPRYVQADLPVITAPAVSSAASSIAQAAASSTISSSTSTASSQSMASSSKPSIGPALPGTGIPLR